MAEGPYLIGIDGGTESVRVGIFDREGAPVVFSSEEYATEHPRPGWAEQNPDEWWSGLVAAVKGAMDESGVSPEEIAGVSHELHGGRAGRARPGLEARHSLDGRA